MYNKLQKDHGNSSFEACSHKELPYVERQLQSTGPLLLALQMHHLRGCASQLPTGATL